MARDRSGEKVRKKGTLFRHIRQQIEVGSQELGERDKLLKLLKEIWEIQSRSGWIHIRSSIAETYLTVHGGDEVVLEVTGGVRYTNSDVERGFDEIMSTLRELRADFDIGISGEGGA